MWSPFGSTVYHTIHSHSNAHHDQIIIFDIFQLYSFKGEENEGKQKFLRGRKRKRGGNNSFSKVATNNN